MKKPVKTLFRTASIMLLLIRSCLSLYATDTVFEYSPWCCPCTTDKHFCDPQFSKIDWPTNSTKPNGHYMMMTGDAHRKEANTNGNDLAQFWNDITTGWTTTTAAAEAQKIDTSAVNNMSITGPKPVWVIINEISVSVWPTDATYRQYVIDVCHDLRVTYGRQVIIYSPWSNPAGNGPSWLSLSAEAYIAPEIYLSGAAIKAQSFSQSWCQTQYQNSINTYTSFGVPSNKIMCGEHYGNTDSSVTWGRAGVTAAEWNQALAVRTKAFLAVPFAGYLSYAWDSNVLLDTDTTLIDFENTQATNMGAIFNTPPPPAPAAPSALTATATSSSQINLAWTDNSTNESNFIISRGTTTGGPYTDIATNAANTTSYSDTGLSASTTYYYVVRAINSGGASANSNEASATTQAPPTITTVHVQSITMSWVRAGSKYKAKAVVNVVDANNVVVANATVTGNFTGAISNSGLSAVTDASGNASITSTSSISTGTVTFTVTNITDTNMSYNSAANVVTSASETR